MAAVGIPFALARTAIICWLVRATVGLEIHSW